MHPIMIHSIAALGEVIFSIWLKEKGLFYCKYHIRYMDNKMNLDVCLNI